MSKAFTLQLEKALSAKTTELQTARPRVSEAFNDLIQNKKDKRHEILVSLSMTLGFDIRTLVPIPTTIAQRKPDQTDIIIDTATHRFSVFNVLPPYYTAKTTPKSIYNNLGTQRITPETIRFVIEHKANRDQLPYFSCCTLTNLGHLNWTMSLSNTYNTQKTKQLNFIETRKAFAKWISEQGMGPAIMRKIKANAKTRIPLTKKPTQVVPPIK